MIWACHSIRICRKMLVWEVVLDIKGSWGVIKPIQIVLEVTKSLYIAVVVNVYRIRICRKIQELEVVLDTQGSWGVIKSILIDLKVTKSLYIAVVVGISMNFNITSNSIHISRKCLCGVRSWYPGVVGCYQIHTSRSIGYKVFNLTVVMGISMNLNIATSTRIHICRKMLVRGCFLIWG